MKEFWLQEAECTGCAACANACPVDAIAMEERPSGFLLPRILPSCVNCNKCEMVCQRRLALDGREAGLRGVFAAYSKDSSVRFESTSGGAFWEIAKSVLGDGGVVCGAAYGPSQEIFHRIARNEAELALLRQSKYAQSDIGYVFREIQGHLSNNVSVLFCGTPCQVAALRSFLGRDFDHLLTMDFICRGVNSPKALRAWVEELQEKTGSSIKRIWFKYKKDGWRKSPRCTRVEFANGEEGILDQENNLFMCGYLGPNLYIRPSCGQCEFKGMKRVSDITVADFWGLPQDDDDDKGTSLVMVNTKKGERAFEASCANVRYTAQTMESALRGNICFGQSVEINPKSKAFLKALDSMTFSAAYKKFACNGFLARCKRRAMRLIKRWV